MLWELVKSLVDWLLLAVSDWLHPKAKAERERIDAEIATQDAAVEAEVTHQGTLTATATTQDAAIEWDKAELTEALEPLPKVERTEDEEFNRLSERIR